MIKVLEAPLAQDLRGFTECLWQQRVPHRGVEQGDVQELWISSRVDANQVLMLYQVWRDGGDLSALRASPARSASVVNLAALRQGWLSVLLIVASVLVSLLTLWIVAKGVQQGIENAVRWMMPGLALMLVALVGYALSSGSFDAATVYVLRIEERADDHFDFAAGVMDGVNHNGETIQFGDMYDDVAFFGAISSLNGGDTVPLRMDDLRDGSAHVFLQEEASADAELNHIDESTSWFAGDVGVYILI